MGTTRLSSFRLHPPHHLIQLVDRRSLVERLDEGRRRRLTLLQAPAGYGKTTLLSQWWEHLGGRGPRIAWLTLDEEDQGTDFLASLTYALAEAGLSVGQLASASFESIQNPAWRAALGALLYELDQLEEDIVVFLDDYHLACSSETDEILSLLIRRMPERMHVAVATRVRPMLPLPTLRAQGQVQELGPEQLRFTPAEALELLRPAIADDDITTLAEHAEGWPIALQLAGLWIRGREDVDGLIQSFSGAGDDMADYLANQVLAGLPEPLQSFLLETSILERINSEVADAIRERSNSRRLLDELKRLNVLLVPADRERLWFRHHHLFAEYLATQQATLGPDRLRRMHDAASRWFEQHGHLVEAVRHAALAGNRARAVTLVENGGRVRLCLSEGASIVKTVIGLLCPAEIEGSARLRLIKALSLFKDGRLREGGAELESARRLGKTTISDPAVRLSFERDLLVVETLRSAYQDRPVPPDGVAALDALAAAAPEADPWFRGLLNNMLCLIFYRVGKIGEAKARVHNALGYYREANSLYGRMFMGLHLGTIVLVQGHLSEASNAFATAEEMAFDYFGGNPTLVALPQIVSAEIAYERNNVTRATELLEENLATLEASEGWAEIYIAAYGLGAALAMAAGDPHAAESLLNRGAKLSCEREMPRVELFLGARRAGLLCMAGRLDDARAQVAALEQATADANANVTWAEADELAVARARLAMAEGAPIAAARLLEEVEASAAAQDRRRAMLRARTIRSLALYAGGETEAAVSLLLTALEQARAESFRRLFIDEGPQMAELLRELSRRIGTANIAAPMVGYIADLLAGFGDLHRGNERARLMQSLTPREQEILRELARGSSNKVIGRALNLTENAVKFHLKNIYRKLGVLSRVMAVSVAQKLGLLS